MWQPHPNVKKVFIGRKEREGFGGFDHEFFYHQTIWFTNVHPTMMENDPLQAYTGMPEESFGSGVVQLNLPEFVLLISCSIVTHHYSFHYRKATFFIYLRAVEAGGQPWLWKLFNAIDIL